MRSAWTKVAVALVAVLVYAQTPEGKRVSVYTAQTGYSLPVVDEGGAEYVGLSEVLEPMGPVTTRVDKKKWRVRFRDVEAEFEAGKTRAKIAGKNVELGSKFLITNNRGLVPVASLPALVNALSGRPTDMHAASRRLFVGATPVRYTAQVQKGAGSRLVLSFSSPVNPRVDTEHGAVRLVFTRDPLESGSTDQVNLGDPLFSSAHFTETNGAAQLEVRVTAPVIASFSDANRTITLTPVNPTAQAGQTPQPPAPSTAPSGPAAAQTPSPVVRRPLFFVLIDPAHGGSDRGAALSASLAEKDATLTLARRLRTELEGKGIPVRMLREGDVEIPSDRRAVAVNTSRAAAVIFLHASTVGSGVHISTAPLPSTSGAVATWSAAQGRWIITSRHWADAVAGEILKRNIAVLRLPASVPPLNETVVPAFVLEITPPPSGQADTLLLNSYVQGVMSAVADATAAERVRLELVTR